MFSKVLVSSLGEQLAGLFTGTTLIEPFAFRRTDVLDFQTLSLLVILPISLSSLTLRYYLNVTFAGRATAAQVSLTSSLQGGFSFILGPLVGRVTDRFGPRITCMIGVTLQVISNLAASFCVESIGGLWATQGILFGIGTCFVSNASLSAPPMYFRKRLSLAFGLATTLGGLGGLCFTFGTQAMLVSLGPAWALRIYAIFIAALLYPSAMVFKSRGAVAASPASNVRRPFFNFKLFADFRFLTMFLAIVLCCMSFPGPFFLPAYAYDAGLPASVGTNLLALMTAMSALSTLIAGALVSKTGVSKSTDFTVKWLTLTLSLCVLAPNRS